LDKDNRCKKCGASVPIVGHRERHGVAGVV